MPLPMPWKIKSDTEQVQAVPSGSVADELLKFKNLLDAGAITEDEYNAQKSRLLNQ